MKRLCSFICAVSLAFVSLFGISSTSVSAENIAESRFIYETQNNEAILVGIQPNISSDIVIPETLGGYPVTAIEYRNDMPGLTYLTSIYIPKTVKNIEASFFKTVEDLQITVDPESEYFVIADNILYTKDMTKIIIVPKNIEVLNIPASVTEFDNNYFSLEYLREINVHEDNTVYASVDGVLYSKDMTTLICCPCKMSDGVRIPEGVTTWADNALLFCYRLSYLVIPESVTEINNFYWYDTHTMHCFYTGDEERYIEVFGSDDGTRPYPFHFNAPHDVELELTHEKATCQTQGHDHLYCPVCDETFEIRTYSGNHDYSILKWLNNGLFGYRYNYECSVCGDTVYAEPQYELGDANGDGKINSTDFILARRHFLGLITLDNEAYMGADINRDGVVNSTDFMQIRRKYLGL